MNVLVAPLRVLPPPQFGATVQMLSATYKARSLVNTLTQQHGVYNSI